MLPLNMIFETVAEISNGSTTAEIKGNAKYHQYRSDHLILFIW
jgi:hypothetical protein